MALNSRRTRVGHYKVLIQNSTRQLFNRQLLCVEKSNFGYGLTTTAHSVPLYNQEANNQDIK